MTKWYQVWTGYFGYPQPEDSYKTITYDPEEGCPRCGVGKKQIGEFRFRGTPKATRSDFFGLNWIWDQIFVRNPVRLELQNSNIKDIRFSSPILHKSGVQLSEVFQLHVDRVIDDLVETKQLDREVCEAISDPEELSFLEANRSRLATGPYCGETKYIAPRERRLQLKSSLLRDEYDIVKSGNWFGSGGAAGQLIFISDKINHLVDENKWRGIFMQEVDLI
jgi:hypothetical protein